MDEIVPYDGEVRNHDYDEKGPLDFDDGPLRVRVTHPGGRIWDFAVFGNVDEDEPYVNIWLDGADHKFLKDEVRKGIVKAVSLGTPLLVRWD